MTEPTGAASPITPKVADEFGSRDPLYHTLPPVLIVKGIAARCE